MTFTLSPWLVIIEAWLMLFGAWFLGSRAWRWAWDAAGRLVYWLRWDRVSGLLEDEEETSYCYPECPPECDCSRLELPPERSWKELTTPAPGVVAMEYLAALRERRAPKWEAEARGHYVAMGLDYPSGLMARVRELTP